WWSELCLIRQTIVKELVFVKSQAEINIHKPKYSIFLATLRCVWCSIRGLSQSGGFANRQACGGLATNRHAPCVSGRRRRAGNRPVNRTHEYANQVVNRAGGFGRGNAGCQRNAQDW